MFIAFITLSYMTGTRTRSVRSTGSRETCPDLSPSKDNCIHEMFPTELITSVPWGDLCSTLDKTWRLLISTQRSLLLGSNRFMCCDATCHISMFAQLQSLITGCFSKIIILKSSITPTPIQQKPPPLSIGLQPFWNILIPCNLLINLSLPIPQV